MRNEAYALTTYKMTRRGTTAKYRQGAVKLVEFAFAASVVAVLAGVLLLHLLDAQEYAEKLAMESTIANMRAGLRAEVGALLIADRASEIAALAGNNPVRWLDKPPENYLGEYAGRPLTDTTGAWYFDSASAELVYTANSRRHFQPSGDSGYTVRLKVIPVSASGQNVASGPAWVRLAVLNDYRWF